MSTNTTLDVVDLSERGPVVHTVTLLSVVAACALYANVLVKVPPAMPGSESTFRARCHMFLSTSLTGSALEAIMAVFSIGSCVTFVWETYLDEEVRTARHLVCVLVELHDSLRDARVVFVYVHVVRCGAVPHRRPCGFSVRR